MTAATRKCQDTVERLFVGVELSKKSWKLAFAHELADRPRLCSMPPGDGERLAEEIARAAKRFALDPARLEVHSIHEAGRDGFWVDRFLREQGIRSVIADSSSIEVDRRQRRAKTDRLDAQKLVAVLMRFVDGEKCLRVVRPPSEEMEDLRHLSRGLKVLKEERAQVTCRMKSLAATQHLELPGLPRKEPDWEGLRVWSGESLGRQLRTRLQRDWQLLELLNQQIGECERQVSEHLRADPAVPFAMARRMSRYAGVGPVTVMTLALELFGWRDIRNRRELASLAGFTPTPYNSGGSIRDQGISKAGNRRVRTLLVEIAWAWLRHQPDSPHSQWFHARFGHGGRRSRRIGIVAVARRILILLWRLSQSDAPPPAQENLRLKPAA